MNPVDRASLCGVVLAGGRARRMGGQDKGLMPLGTRPMVEYVLQNLRPQVGTLVINANRNKARYGKYGYPVIGDTVGDYNGPLAGMASALEWTDRPYLLTVPCDSPFLPDDLGARLLDTLRARHAELAVAHDGDRLQPVFALLDVALLPSLQHYLARGERKIDRWYGEHRFATADFSDRQEMFLNVNTLEERDSVMTRIAGYAQCP